MTVILCAGKNGEVLFNNRRCSRDRAVISDILSRLGEKPLWVSPYSAPLFEDAPVCIAESPEALGDICFLEDLPLSAVAQRMRTLILYRFDRAYPADVRVTIPEGFRQVAREEFAGFSHEKITREVYEA